MSGEQGDIIDIEIAELAAGGDGVGRDANGRVTFVARTAPGDRVSARLREVRRDFARADLMAVDRRGPERVVPRCRYFDDGRCGGCQWQHVAMPVQHQAKSTLVHRALRHLTVAGLVIEPLVTPVSDYHWRRRARLHWFRAPAAPRAEMGFFAPRSHFVTDVDDCPQLSPALTEAWQVVRAVLGPSLFGRGELHLLEAAGGTHVVVEGNVNPGACKELAAVEGIRGVRCGRRRFGDDMVDVDGMAHAADDFAQASAAGNDELRRRVEGMSAPWRRGARILELFAGGGNLTQVLEGAAQIVAVDRQSRPPAGTAVQWRSGDATEVVATLVQEDQRFDAVVLDPPRTGAREVMSGIAALAPKHILYVSCSPPTLARDATMLVEAGYTPVRAVPIDLMPQTAHIEVVMELRANP